MRASTTKLPSAEFKKWRVAEGHTQNDVARKLGVSRLSVVNIEHGKQPIRAAMAAKLGSVTGIPAAKWLAWQAEIDLQNVR